MKRKDYGFVLLLLSPVLICFLSCRGNQRQDTVITSAANPSRSYRATVILRQYYVDGKFDDSPTTYVVLDKDSGAAAYANGVEFTASQVVMKPTQCGPLSVKWSGDYALTVVCEKCGLALSAVGPHADGLGPIKIQYDGFPQMSSWETAPHSN